MCLLKRLLCERSFCELSRQQMLHAVLIVNNHGKPRLTKFYDRMSEEKQQQIIRECFNLVSRRTDKLCNFLEADLFGEGTKLVYRHYATLYFVFVVDGSESELAILDLIQVFVEALDKCFENVCELDLIFHFDRVCAKCMLIPFGSLCL